MTVVTVMRRRCGAPGLAGRKTCALRGGSLWHPCPMPQ
nr:hypothetical protein RVX_0145 [Nitratidesulfovibrio sp. HK-II]